MSVIASSRAKPLLAAIWFVFASVMAALMYLLPGKETIPYHLIWASYALLYGLYRWALTTTWLTFSGITVVTGIPMIKHAGFDLVWFGIFVVLVVEMAEVSPPVGFNLFVLQTMSGKDSNTVAKAALPFFFLLVLAVAIITVFPSIVMVLPQMAFPG